MGFLDKLFGNKKGERTELSQAQEIVDIIRKQTSRPSVTLHLQKEKTTIYQSKIGGMPYMPVDFPYPHDETVELENRPLRFLAQINFEEMPPLEGFPTSGILQFYLADGDAYGMNFEELTLQKAFRLIYHDRVQTDIPLQDVLPEMPESSESPEKTTFPVNDELRIRFNVSEMAMGGGDFRFDRLFLEAYNKLNPEAKLTTLERVPEKIMDEVYDSLDTGGSHISGYPAFTQIDPREYYEVFREHTVLLLQIDSVETDDYSVQWGDGGVCHFFIRPEDLLKKDFSDVVYSWDCY